MTDVFDPGKRSRIMSSVRTKDTAPELVVRRLLHRAGFRYRLHVKDLPGKPDIVLPRHRAVIFVNGCFWHGHEECRRAARPQTRAAFWNDKISRNRERDERVTRELEASGWRVLTVWQCEIGDRERLEHVLIDFLNGKATR